MCGTPVDGVGVAKVGGVTPGPYHASELPEAESGVAASNWQYTGGVTVGAAGLAFTVTVNEALGLSQPESDCDA